VQAPVFVPGLFASRFSTDANQDRRVSFYTVLMASRVKSKASAAAASKMSRAKAAERTMKTRETKAGRVARRATEQLELETEELRGWVCGWDFELEARAEGSTLIAGVDEVGRGPLFGPVVAAAVILPESCCLDGLNDSKKLSEEERERFDAMVREVAVCWAVAEVDVRTIDRINILQASRLAMKIAVESLGTQPDHLLIDGNQKIDFSNAAVCRQRTIVQGDARSMSIAAASVIAKVHRDRLLRELDRHYPGYGLAHNKGYSTPEHKAALLRLGITEMHRRSFAPVAELFEAEIESIEIEFGLIAE
jgi:ribonuclease HII